MLGVSLKERMAEKLLITKQKQYMQQLLSGLAEMRKKNIIHRDLKPDNIMLRTRANGDEECVIIDLGLGTRADARDYLFHRCGTPGFLAPEIANLQNKKTRQTCATDMFSLGCIFFKMYLLNHSGSPVTTSFRAKPPRKSFTITRTIFTIKPTLALCPFTVLLQLLRKKSSHEDGGSLC
jgi:serine/threonine protein kinase